MSGDWARVERGLRYISQVGNGLTPLPELAALTRLRASDQTKTDALREYVDACIAEADAAAEAGMIDEGDLWPASVQDAKRRVNNAYEDLFALARGEHTPRCGVWYELDDVTGILHAVGTCDCILAAVGGVEEQT